MYNVYFYKCDICKLLKSVETNKVILFNIDPGNPCLHMDCRGHMYREEL